MERLIDFEKNINKILLGNNNNDLNYIKNIYSETVYIEGLNINLKNNLYKFISNKMNEFYKNELNKLTAKDKNNITKYIEEIKSTNFEVDPDLIKKFETILQQTPIKKK